MILGVVASETGRAQTFMTSVFKADKFADECYKRVVRNKSSKLCSRFIETGAWSDQSCKCWYKVRNERGEQNSLERLAKDGDSPVRQVSLTLLFVS